MKMTKAELVGFIDAALKNSVRTDGEWIRDNADLLDYYLGEPLGDEEEGRSQVVSTDVQDLVEADMPSLARVFLGSQDILEFQANSGDPQAIQEAEEKTKYINWLVRGQRDSFRTIHGWIKASEIHKVGAVHFCVDEQKKTDEREYKGLSGDELALLMQSIEAEKGVSKVDVVSQSADGDLFDVKLRVTSTSQKYKIENIPVENLHISKDATCKDDAEIIGHVSITTRGALVAMGYSKETVEKLDNAGYDSEGRLIADKRLPGSSTRSDADGGSWASEKVLIENLYPLVDFDGDGVAERRRVVKSGQTILKNESFGIVPYAFLSAVLMPNALVGRSRAELAKPTQYVKTHLTRQILDNIYQVNRPRTVINDSAQGGVELDDLLTHRLDGIVRVDGPVVGNILPLETPYIGDKALMVVQYVDSMRAQTTGSLMASQGLSVDALHKETATRFEGVNDQSQAKIELVARVMAETGFRELYEGLAWLVMHYQDDEAEFAVLGKPMTANPSAWRYEQYCASQVGLAAGDSEQMMASIAGIIAKQEQLMSAGSPLVDHKKLYNSYSKLTKLAGIAKVGDYFNDPEVPQEVLMAQVQQLSQQLQMIQSQLQDPALVRAQAQAEVDKARAQNQLQLEENRQQGDMTKFMLEQAAKQDQFQKDMLFRLTELDLKYNGNPVNDIPGTLEGDEVY